MIHTAIHRGLLAAGLLTVLLPPTRAADLVALSPQTWDRYIPQGKEVDGIHGDFVLANDQLLAVVANPRHGRDANANVRNVGGCLIDLTRRDRQSDQLIAFYPGAQGQELKFAGIEVEAPTVYEAAELDRVFVQAHRVTLRLVRLVASPREKELDVEVSYALQDGWPSLQITTTFTNRGTTPRDADLLDAIAADRSFERSPDGVAALFWAYDKHFGQAYGVVADDHEILSASARQLLLRYQAADGKVAVRLAPGASYTLTRRIIPGANLFDVRRVAGRLAGKPDHPVRLTVKDTAGQPVPDAEVVLERNRKPQAWGRTDAEGRLLIDPGDAAAGLTVSALGRGSQSIAIAPDAPQSLAVELPAAGSIVARISDEQGGTIPCKVQFIGRGETRSPDFGPDTGEHAVKNVFYSHDGRFRRELEPGSYDVIVSYGPEYDAVFTQVDVVRGKEARLEAKLVRTVKTDGWMSADFHSHSTASGDNTSSQLGRVLNLLCEHVEFAPCTEHNRLSSYDPHLKHLGSERRMATCVGIELSGEPFALNHQNAFPLVLRPNTQDGGGPAPDDDPATQIERLALWDGASDKLVQVNHADMGWMFRDRNGDGTADSGFTGMFGHIDVIEVHPLQTIFAGPTARISGRMQNNRIINWFQLLNQGRRIPGVVNTDAHYNFHGSGWVRNYLKSPTDDPAEVRVLDMVHAAEQGHVIMTNGPFLEVEVRAGSSGAAPAIAGDVVVTRSPEATVRVKVQCPNWFDVDRVQVFLNGHPAAALNFTRRTAPDRFTAATVKFDQEIPLHFDRDTHVVVAAIGEHSKLGPVMGPARAGNLPIAVSNPIFVDVDGDGFKPSGDTLGDLPTKNSP